MLTKTFDDIDDDQDFHEYEDDVLTDDYLIASGRSKNFPDDLYEERSHVVTNVSEVIMRWFYNDYLLSQRQNRATI